MLLGSRIMNQNILHFINLTTNLYYREETQYWKTITKKKLGTKKENIKYGNKKQGYNFR